MKLTKDRLKELIIEELKSVMQTEVSAGLAGVPGEEEETQEQIEQGVQGVKVELEKLTQTLPGKMKVIRSNAGAVQVLEYILSMMPVNATAAASRLSSKLGMKKKPPTGAPKQVPDPAATAQQAGTITSFKESKKR